MNKEKVREQRKILGELINLPAEFEEAKHCYLDTPGIGKICMICGFPFDKKYREKCVDQALSKLQALEKPVDDKQLEEASKMAQNLIGLYSSDTFLTSDIRALNILIAHARKSKATPKLGKFWCNVCDNARIRKGERCPNCGVVGKFGTKPVVPSVEEIEKFLLDLKFKHTSRTLNYHILAPSEWNDLCEAIHNLCKEGE